MGIGTSGITKREKSNCIEPGDTRRFVEDKLKLQCWASKRENATNVKGQASKLFSA
jgi:hypothetical protein